MSVFLINTRLEVCRAARCSDNTCQSVIPHLFVSEGSTCTTRHSLMFLIDICNYVPYLHVSLCFLSTRVTVFLIYTCSCLQFTKAEILRSEITRNVIKLHQTFTSRTHPRTHTHTHRLTDTHAHTHMHRLTDTHTRACAHTYVHTYACPHTHATTGM